MFATEVPERAAVDLMVEILPSVDQGYFWAMQVDWDDGSGAHIGLQWWPGYPDHRAINWGGYGTDGEILTGSVSPFPSSLDNPNTRDFPWVEGQWYNLEVDSEGRGFVDGQEVRRLDVKSRNIVRVGVWTEMFAPCRAPHAQVRWRGLPERLECTYGSGCGNTVSWREGDELVQATGLSRWPSRRPGRRRPWL